MYLLFAYWLPRWVQLTPLERTKQMLYGCSIVRVGAGEASWHLHLAQVTAHLLTRMPGGVIKQRNRIVTPGRVIQVQLPDQVLNESHHGITVCVGMAQGEVDLATSIQCSNHGESRSHSSIGHRTSPITWAPHLTSIVGGVDPTFVNIQDAGLGLEQRQHRLGVLLS